jgi:hypothetical protein
MEFTVEDLTRTTLNRGILRSEMVLAYTANVILDNGDWIGLSKYDDEDHWIADCAFKANGLPLWSNGTGSRCVAGRTVAPEVVEALDAAVDADISGRLS